ncbi:hypothetical protein [Duganella sp. Root1480D1]|uniref:hypothetical protein n=1 Tax=Duganella sp. Root1480D1 TaxID=1736471 RepID=UPI0007102ECB|nr:hypothetical protein [Duganella sp. Root1480D1]KQZ30488.1 hypothetical protein ASD58_10795 [Duganella sp. Root1480D1]
MSHQAILTYDKQLLRRAVLAYWRRSVGVRLPLALSVVAIAFAWLLAEGCYSGFWLLLFSKAQFITLPLETVSQEMQAFVLKSVQASGGKVVG